MPVVVAGAVLLRVLAGVGFANYDTLYALAWGGQLARGESPAYDLPIAPTPHPLIEALGVVLYPLGPRAGEKVAVWLGFLALAACGWVVYRLASLWFGRAAGVLAALLLLTRVPILSYGVRAYVDVPYLLLVLGALLLEARRRAAGRAPGGGACARAARARRPAAPGGVGVLGALLAVSDRLRARRGRGWHRPRAALAPPARGAGAAGGRRPARVDHQRSGHHRRRAVVADEHAPHRATLDRVTGIGNVPEYIPRRIGEILRPPVLVGAALGGVLSLLWLPGAVGAAVGVPAVVVFVAVAIAGCRSTRATRSSPRRSSACSAARGSSVGRASRRETRGGAGGWPAARSCLWRCSRLHLPVSPAHRELDKLARQDRSRTTSLALVSDHAITRRCEPVACPTTRRSRCSRCTWKQARRDRERGANEITSARTSTRRAKRSKTTTCSTPTTRTYRQRAPGIHRTHANRSWLHLRPLQVVDRLRALAHAWTGSARCKVADRHPASRSRHRPPTAARDSGPGALAAPAGDRLRLLPPDLT